MKIDYQSLIDEVDIWSVIDRLNIETNYGQGNAYPKGNSLGVKSPFRTDNSIGSCVINIRGKYKGLFTDWAENYHCNFVKYVSAVLNIPWWEAEEFIAKDYGGRPAFFIPGTESEYELEHGITKHYTQEKATYKFPAMLTHSDLLLIGLNEYSHKNDSINNYIIKSCSNINPKREDIKINDYIIKMDVPNPKYKDSCEPEYLSFIDYVNGIKNPKGSDEEPFNTIYCIGEQQKSFSLSELYRTDKYTYYMLIRQKAKETLENLESIIKKYNSIKRFDVELRADAKSKRRMVKKILQKFSLEDADFNECLKEHFKQDSQLYYSECEGY